MKKMLLGVGVVMLLSAGNLFAEEEDLTCSGDEVKVCFADGKNTSCICKVRDVDMSDTVENPSSCYDPDDSGSCGTPPPEESEPAE